MSIELLKLMRRGFDSESFYQDYLSDRVCMMQQNEQAAKSYLKEREMVLKAAVHPVLQNLRTLDITQEAKQEIAHLQKRVCLLKDAQQELHKTLENYEHHNS